MLKSHINPDKSLEEHLKEVANNSKKIILNKELNLSLISRERLSDIAYLIGVSHDFGKATTFFQDYLTKNKFPENKSLKDHSLISAFFCYFLIKEFLIGKENSDLWALIGFLIVKKHHGNLEDISNCFRVDEQEVILKKQLKNLMEKKEVNKIYERLLHDFGINYDRVLEKLDKTIHYDLDEFIDNLNDFIDNKIYLNNSLEIFVLNNLLYSCLIDSDKKDAANIKTLPESFYFSSKIVDEYLEKINNDNLKINKIRKKFYREVNENTLIKKENKIYSITAPTGIGKTLTALSTAFKLKEKLNKNYKLIYSLPFTSVIDQNYEEIRKVLKNYFLDFEEKEYDFLIKHHYLSDINLDHKKIESDYDVNSLLNKFSLIESWDSNIIITTFVQLFTSIIGYKNKSLKKFHNIINSIIILDEIQTLPNEYWLLTKKMFKELSDKFNVYFIFVTATQPFIFDKNEIIELSEPKKYFELPEINRVNFTIENMKMSIDEFYELFKKEFDKRINSYLIIFNTRNSVDRFYKKLIGDPFFNSYKKFCLSNNLLPLHLKEKIKEIYKTKKSIIVSTQLVEAGVNLSVEKLYRDIAPIDSLIQSAGRCNRNNEYKNKGEVVIINLIDENNKLFSNYIYDFDLLNETKNILEEKKYPSKKVFKLVNQFFSNIKNNKTIESKLILNAVKRLNYSQKKQDEIPISKFKLIKEMPFMKEVIIVYDNNSEELINKLQELRETHDLTKKLLLKKKLWKEIAKYTISISEKKFNELQGVFKEVYPKSNIFFLPKEFVKQYYDFERGFFIEDETIF